MRLATYRSAPLSGQQQPPNKVDSVASATPLLWRLGLTAIFYWILNWGGNDLAEAFVRTIIKCEAPTPQGGLCPKGTFYSDGACAPVAKHSPDWSGSALCLKKDDVMEASTKFLGQVTSVRLVTCLFLSAFAGPYLIDCVGRKVVLLLSLVFLVIANAIICIACRLLDRARLLIYFYACCSAFMVMFLSASWAMAADLVPKDATSRSVSYSFLSVIQHTGIVITYGAGFFVLRMNLIDYTWVYLFLSLFALLGSTLTALILPETAGMWKETEAAHLVSRDGDALDRADKSRNPVRELVNAFSIVWQDKFLRHNCLVCFVTSMTSSGCIQMSGSFGISTANFTIAAVSLGGVFQPVCIVIGSLLCSPFTDRIGPFWTYYIASAIVVLGYVVTGLTAYFPDCAQSLYWLGWCPLTGLGYGLSVPSYTAMQSMRLDSQHHGKLFAVQGVFGSQCFGAGAIVGTYVWSNFFYDGVNTQGWSAAKGFFISAAMMCLTTCYGVSLWRAYILPELMRDRACAVTEA